MIFITFFFLALVSICTGEVPRNTKEQNVLQSYINSLPRGEVNQFSSPHEDLLLTIRMQSARLAEGSLSAKSEENIDCLKRMLCATGVIRSGMKDSNVPYLFPRISPGRGIEDFKRILDQMVADIEQSGDSSEFPNIYRTISSFSVGRATSDQNICETLFKCATTGESMIIEAMQSAADDGETVPNRDSRTTCQASGFLCPGIAIGCSLCSIFSPGTCGDQCIMAGLYCGTSAYACKAAKTSTTPAS